MAEMPYYGLDAAKYLENDYSVQRGISHVHGLVFERYSRLQSDRQI